MAGTHVVIPYAPRPLQKEIHRELEKHRLSVIVCHRRFGKTVMAINHLIRAALLCKLQRPRFGYVAPTYRMAKSIAWDYLKHYTQPIPGVEKNEVELRVDLPNGGRVQLYGADNPDSLRGGYFDGLVLDEYGLMDGRVYSEVLLPALADRKGWSVFIGTPNGKNAFWTARDNAERTPGQFLAEYRASQTGIIDSETLAEAKRQMTADEYAQEWECSFEASVRGAVYAAEIAALKSGGRVTRVPHDPALPVHTFWDLGIGDSTSVGFVQCVGPEVRAIDYYEASGEGLPHYAQVLGSKGYTYGQHYAPHDIAVRELGSGRSRIETAASLGIKFAIAPNVPLEDGVHATRLVLPRMWFDADKCGRWLECLQNYRWDYNEKLGEFKPTPIHDWASHGADMTRYMAVSLKEKVDRKSPKLTGLGVGGWMR